MRVILAAKKDIVLMLLWKGLTFLLGSNCHSSNSRRTLAGCATFWWTNYPDWLQMCICPEQKLPSVNDIIGLEVRKERGALEKTYLTCLNVMETDFGWFVENNKHKNKERPFKPLDYQSFLP